MTKVYGTSDDLVEIEGDITGEVSHYDDSDEGNDETGVLLSFSDGTLLRIKYGKAGQGIWAITIIHCGDLFIGIDECHDEDAKPYSDVVTFEKGLKWVYAATRWEKVK